jgi:hypothetical protein
MALWQDYQLTAYAVMKAISMVITVHSKAVTIPARSSQTSMISQGTRQQQRRLLRLMPAIRL